MSEATEVETVFLVQVNTDGTFIAHLEQPEETLVAKRAPTTADVLTSSQGLVKEIEHAQLTDRILMGLVTLMAGPPKASETVKDKLKERGIDPESSPVTP